MKKLGVITYYDVDAGVFVGKIPELDVMSQGRNVQEAIAATYDAAALAFAYLRDEAERVMIVPS